MKKVLLVGDAVFTRYSLKDILEGNGYEVTGEASNGMDAIVMFRALKPDIVTIDITKPELDGIKVIEMIRLADENAKIIVLASIGQEHLIKQALKAGVLAFIVKPFEKDDVTDAFGYAQCGT